MAQIHNLTQLQELFVKLKKELSSLKIKKSSVFAKEFPDRYQNIVHRKLQKIAGEEWDTKNMGRRVFPDIRIDQYGLEVKVQRGKSKLTPGQSIFSEKEAAQTFLLLAQFDEEGKPSIVIDRYYKFVAGVKQTHKARFMIDFDKPFSESESIFLEIIEDAKTLYDKRKINWDEFNSENFSKE